jgi:hypothetical protein
MKYMLWQLEDKSIWTLVFSMLLHLLYFTHHIYIFFENIQCLMLYIVAENLMQYIFFDIFLGF